MNKITIIVLGKKHTFNEIVYSLTESLILLGYKINKIFWYDDIRRTKTINVTEKNIYIGCWWWCQEISVNKNAFNIYFNTEQPSYHTDIFKKRIYRKKIEQFDVVIDMFKNQLRPKKPIYRYCPAGWSSYYDRNYDKTIKKDINVLHIGKLQINNTTIPNIHKSITMKNAVFGKERDRLIQRSYINLSLRTFHPNYEWTQYRMLYTLGLRGFLLGQEHTDYGPYQPGKHFITFKDDEFEDVYNYWLNKPKDMIDFGMTAYEDIKQNHKYTMYLEKILKGIL